MTCVLVPLVTEKEGNVEFMNLLNGYDKLILLYVVDEELGDVPAGFVGSRIKSAETIMDSIIKNFPIKEVKEYVEWGSWADKVQNTFRLENADAVLMADSKKAQGIKAVLDSNGIPSRIISV